MWTDESALSQIENGEPWTERTESAYAYLESAINGDGKRLDNYTEDVAQIARALLGLWRYR